MRPLETRTEALRLVELGLNDCEIARRLGIPRTTVRDWRNPRYVPRASARCPRCWRRVADLVLPAPAYAELLGLYLGDGHISQVGRVERLRIFLDARYARVVDDTEALLRGAFPANKVGRVTRHDGRMVVLWLYSNHLSCLFPQHGGGKKHERRIRLEPWQKELVDRAPWRFLKGCIRSDGCVFVNRTGRYEYVSYDFSNLSQDILDLFATTCVAVGLRPRRYARHVRLNRRDDVARLLDHVGVKE